MSQYFYIHPHNPQIRLIKQAVALIQKGAVIAFPTDSCYALGCALGDKKAAERIRRIRQVDDKHNFTLVCRDLGEIATYAKIDNQRYRMLKRLTPGAYTFILKATHEVPRRLMHPKRKEIGIRVPENAITEALLDELREPIMSSTLHLPGDEFPVTDIEEVRHRLEKVVDLIIDGGHCGIEPTTVINMVENTPFVTRVGKGEIDIDFLEK